MPDKEMDDGSGPNVGGVNSGYRSTPIPDPTVLTTQALYREVAALKELIEQRIAAVDTSIQAAIAARTELDLEIQRRTDLQFVLVEQQRVEQKADTKNAVDAALTAQKEAIQKAENGTTKQIEQLQTSFKTEVDALRRSIDENKERIVDLDKSLRLTISEVATTANAYGQQKQGGTDSRAVIAWGLAAVLSLITIGAIVIAAIKP